MKNGVLIILLFTQFNFFSQVSNFSSKFNLPSNVEETSGLVFINNKIVTHNDSGGEAKLYEIDNTSGLITRTITISNAINVDWEDITEDETHIYIGDIGNNNGTRTDLTIYKVLKSDYLNSNSVTAEIITFSFEDQSDFTSKPNNNNFDAEAISIYQNNIVIFTKNWADLNTNTYVIPITSGNHSAIKTSTYNVSGLITGSSYNEENDSFMLVGYNNSDGTPFLLYIDRNRNTGNDIFNGGAEKTILTTELGILNQVEGIIHLDNLNYYISREKVTFGSTTNTQALFEFTYSNATTWQGDDGSSPTDWATAENWDDGIPTLSSNVTIPSAPTNQPIIAATTGATVNNLSVNGSLSIVSGGSLIVNGTPSGNITYNVNIPDQNWHLVSSPVVGEEYDDTWITTNNIAFGTVNNRAISTYDNGTPDPDTDGEGPDTATQYWRYFQANGVSTAFTSGVGYSNKRTASGNYSFTGTFPTSDVAPAISQNNNNWNLLGNPYPSYLDIAAFLTENTNKLAGAYWAIFVWNGTTYTSLTSGYLHPGQGFFVNSDVALDVATFTTDMQSHQTGITFYKNSNPNIQLVVTDGNETKTTEINYKEGKTLGLDPGFDIGLFDGVATNLSVYSHLVKDNKGVSFQKQTLPLDNITSTTIPIGIKSAAGKELVFSLETTQLPSNLKVYLEDRSAEKFISLSTSNASYKVTITEELNGIGRFYLHTTNSTLNTSENNFESLSIFKKDKRTIRISGVNGNASMKLYDIKGKEILQRSFYVEGFKDLDLPKITTGIYIVEVQTGNRIFNKKIYLE